LTDEERIVFQRLSVFCGGFYLEAAQQVAASIQWIPLMLNILIDTGRLLACINERELSIEVLSAVAHYPSANEFVRREARRLLAETVLSGAPQPRITSALNAIALAVQQKLGTPALLKARIMRHPLRPAPCLSANWRCCVCWRTDIPTGRLPSD